MNRRSLENLQMDRRLAGRAGWISQAELQRQAAELPDVSDKVAEEEEPTPEESDEAPPGADPLIPG